MEYIYPPSNEVGKDDNQLCLQSSKETFVDDYPLCMYDYPQATTSRPPVSCFPGTTQCVIVAAEGQQQLRQYILSLQKLLRNFAVYHFRCQLTIKVYGSYLGQTRVQLVLRKTKTGVTSYKDYTFQSHVMIKEQLKQAVLELAQPLLTNLLPCSRCNIKHYEKSCKHPFLPNTNHENGC